MNNNDEISINNKFDYSNIIPNVKNITYIIQYLDGIYNQFTKLVNDDETKNEKLKREYKNYLYKHHYASGLDIRIRKNYEIVNFKNYVSYNEALNNNQIKNVDEFEVKLNLSYYRGKEDSSMEYENSFIISFKPYDITFTRTSNRKTNEMDLVEKNINDLMKKFPTADTIFYTQ